MRSPRSVLRGLQFAGWSPATSCVRAYSVRTVPDIKIPLVDGTHIVADLYLPDTDEELPALLGWSPYNKDLLPTGAPAPFNEPGDVTYLAKSGYAVIIVNTRGTGRSSGELPLAMFSESELEDMRQAFVWIAAAGQGMDRFRINCENNHWGTAKVDGQNTPYLTLSCRFDLADRSIVFCEGHWRVRGR